MSYIVFIDDDLVKFLVSKGYSKNKVKSLVKYRCIKLNNKAIDKLPCKLNRGDILEINKQKNNNLNFKIIY